jgi:glycosyltransferase involved in cell wall biosynthesis
MENLVSIIIPTYNTGRFLYEAIESVIGQSYNEWELIIIDDGSDIDIKEDLIPYLKDERIKYIKKENSGVCDTRNLGAKMANGNFLCFLDADDIYLKDNLKEKVKYLKDNPEIPLIHANVEVVDKNSKPTGIYYKGLGGYVLDDLLLWQTTVIPAPSSIMIRKTVFYEIGEWDINFSTAADQDFFFRICAKYKIGHINNVLTKYRLLDDSMSRNIQLMEIDHIAVYQKTEKNGLFKTFIFKRKCFSNLYLTLSGSWFTNGNNKIRGLKFLIKSIFYYPPVCFKLIRKITQKH